MPPLLAGHGNCTRKVHPPWPGIPQPEQASGSSEGLLNTGWGATSPEFLTQEVQVGGLRNHTSTSQELLLLVSESLLHTTDPSHRYSVDLAEGNTPGAFFLSGQMLRTLSDASCRCHNCWTSKQRFMNILLSELKRRP